MQKFIFLLAILLNSIAFSQSNCDDASALTISPVDECKMQTFSYSEQMESHWFQFQATYTAANFVINSLSDPQVQFASVRLYSGDCSYQILEEIVTPNATSDTLIFDSLTLNQSYYIEIIRSSTLSAGNFEICATQKAADSYWTNHFYNSSGGTMLLCQTLFPANVDPTDGNQGCNDVTVCIDDELNLEIIAPLDISGVLPDPDPCPYYIVFVNQNGAVATYTPNAAAAELTTLTFNQTGDVTFYMIPVYYPVNSVSYNTITSNPDMFLFTIHVTGEQPQAVWDDQVICAEGEATLTALDFSTFSNVTVDGVAYPSGSFQITFNSNNFNVGTHTVVYTLTGACGPVTYTTTFTIAEENDLDVSIDNCGNAVFSYSGCGINGNFNATLNCGDGTVLTGALVNGSIIFTHHYTNTSPLTWGFLVEYPNGIDVFTQSGTYNGITVQALQLSADEYLCEMVNPITITSPSGLTDIVWSTDPSVVFGGQGTTTLTPAMNWATSTNDITVSVTATNANGCLFEGSVTITACCGPKGQVENNEYFERTYYSHTAISGLNQLVPAGSYYAPQNVVISLPDPPALVTSTQYSNPTTLTALIAANGWTVTNGALVIPNTLYLNNDLIIDQSILLLNSRYIRLAPNARIIVNAGIVFKARNCTFAPKCDEMWGGIYANSSNSGIVLEQSNVVGAIRGIQTVNGPDIDVLSCIFVDNYIGIQVDTDAAATPNKVRNTYFGDVTGQPLLFPYNTQLIPETGILLRTVREMTIGSTATFDNTAATMGNLFQNMKRGVDAQRSTFYVYRSTFFQMKHAAGQPEPNEGDTYCGVRATNVHSPANTVTVGTLSTNRNIFVACDYGISAKTSMNMNARWSYMREIRLIGIAGVENPSCSMNIWDNQINSGNPNSWGIYVKNYQNGTAIVRRNQINNSAGSSANSFARMATGIYASSVTPNVVQTTEIIGNTVRNCLYGIWVINIQAGNVSQNNITMDYTDAVINSLSASYAPIRGVVVQNSNTAKINNNSVTRNLGFASGVTNDKLQGIRLELSPAATVWKNTLTRTSVGFYALGSSLGSKVECNHLNNNRNGFWMQSADISNQGSAINVNYPNGLSAHNVWTSNLANNTDGTTIGHSLANPLRYYHQSGVTLGSNPTPIIMGIPYFWMDLTLSGTPATTCGSSFNLEPIEFTDSIIEREAELRAVVEGEVLYDSLDAEMKHYLDQATLSRLQQDSTLLNMNVPEDTDYQLYVLSMEGTETDKLLKVQEAIAMQAYDSAAVKIAALDITDPRSDLIRIVETIWNNSQLTETPISAEDSITLFDIACMDPLVNGSAVYQARAILDWDGWCTAMAARSSSANLDEENAEAVLTNVFPNPSNGQFKVEATDEITTVLLYDLKGTLIQFNEVNAKEYDADYQLKAGIYVIRIILQHGNVETHKIEIH